jgi:NADPH:quinone reductase-like Zn-dependent oxidoreductase
MEVLKFSKYKELDKPVPKDDEVLLKVYSTTVTPMDWKFEAIKSLLQN